MEILELRHYAKSEVIIKWCEIIVKQNKVIVYFFRAVGITMSSFIEGGNDRHKVQMGEKDYMNPTHLIHYHLKNISDTEGLFFRATNPSNIGCIIDDGYDTPLYLSPPSQGFSKILGYGNTSEFGGVDEINFQKNGKLLLAYKEQYFSPADEAWEYVCIDKENVHPEVIFCILPSLESYDNIMVNVKEHIL